MVVITEKDGMFMESTSDAAAYLLLQEIAEKSAEIWDTDNAGKTVGAWRREVGLLLARAVDFVALRRRQEAGN